MAGSSSKNKVPESKGFIAELGDKLTHRDSSEAGVVVTRADNAAGNWYLMTTVGGMSIGWWHQTDLQLHPRSAPPATKSNDG